MTVLRNRSDARHRKSLTDSVVEVITPAPRSEWRRLCDDDPSSVLSQEPEWTDALTRWTNWVDASRLYRTRDGRSFVLPLVRRGPIVAGGQAASMPMGWGMGGFVGSTDITSQDVAAVMADLSRLRDATLRVLPNPLRGEAWSGGLPHRAIALPRYAHVLDLDGGIDTVRSERYSRSGRRTVRRALKAGLDIERDTTGRLISTYRDLFQRSIDRWAECHHEPLWLARLRGGREDPPGKLEYLAKALGGRIITRVASYRGEPAAASLMLAGNSHFGWRLAMHEELGPATNATYALVDHAIEEACADGARYKYLGETGRAAGIALFKERLGGVGHVYPEVRSERLPITRATQGTRTVAKRLVGYRQH